MKLQQDTNLNINTVTHYDESSVTINGERYTQGLVVMPGCLETAWATSGQVSMDDMQRVAALRPALVLIGTGMRQQFPVPTVLRPLVEAGIGFEVMDTGSACRTYNLLAGEGRLVAAALLIGRAD